MHTDVRHVVLGVLRVENAGADAAGREHCGGHCVGGGGERAEDVEADVAG